MFLINQSVKTIFHSLSLAFSLHIGATMCVCVHTVRVLFKWNVAKLILIIYDCVHALSHTFFIHTTALAYAHAHSHRYRNIIMFIECEAFFVRFLIGEIVHQFKRYSSLTNRYGRCCRDRCYTSVIVCAVTAYYCLDSTIDK